MMINVVLVLMILVYNFYLLYIVWLISYVFVYDYINIGLPEDVRVIAWGLSLERPTMIKYHIDNIRDLFGHKADLLSQRDAPIARF